MRKAWVNKTHSMSAGQKTQKYLERGWQKSSRQWAVNRGTVCSCVTEAALTDKLPILSLKSVQIWKTWIPGGVGGWVKESGQVCRGVGMENIGSDGAVGLWQGKKVIWPKAQRLPFSLHDTVEEHERAACVFIKTSAPSYFKSCGKV